MFDQFIQQYLRGQNIWLTVAHQSVNQIDGQVRNSLFSLGSYLFGRTGTMSEARFVADLLYKRDPYFVKYWHRVWAHEPIINSYSRSIIGTNHFVIDHRLEFMSLDEQQEESAARIYELSLFEFLCRPAIREGEVSHSVIPLSIANLDRDEETGEYQFPDYDRVARFREALAAKDGIPAAAILKELDSSLPAPRAERDGHAQRLREQTQRQLKQRGDGNPQHTGEESPRKPRHQRRERLS
jgi:hypothetical protein